MSDSTLRVGADIGGTFTDVCVLDDDGIVAVSKGLTTHDAPARAVQEILGSVLERHDLDPRAVKAVVHGTTLVTNALIERRGAPTALLMTQGFRDIVEMGREHRYELYDLEIELPRPLVPRHLRFDVPERTLSDGSIERCTDVAHVRRLAHELDAAGIEAVAICFLHSIVNPANERAAAAAIAAVAPNIRIALSSHVNAEIREFERASTTAANVYVQAIVEDYLADLRQRLRSLGLIDPLIMLSNGGVATLDVAAQFPIRMLESGPAGGALGAVRFAEGHELDDLLAFDMGGTTAKLCIIEDRRPLVSHAFEVDRIYRLRPGSGLPVRASVIDMIEIGAGGGSIARVDPLGLIAVGPHSAGSEPGPICYGRGATEVTVTDADLALGYLAPESFLGGSMELDIESARAAIGCRLAAPIGISIEEAAYGIHATVNANMANAARVHAIERGEEPSELPLFVSGGNGPLHGPGVAQALGATTVIAPPSAGVLSALGFLAAPLSIDLLRAHHAPLDALTPKQIGDTVGDLIREGSEILLASAVQSERITHELSLDLRFVGQGTELTVVVPLPCDGWVDLVHERFLDRYHERFGAVAPNVAVEVLTWRLTARGPDPGARLSPAPGPVPDRESQTGSRSAWFPTHGWHTIAVHDRTLLRPGDRIDGPAVIDERESTLLVIPGAHATMADDFSIVLELPRR